jgi:hypothetical protein
MNALNLILLKMNIKGIIEERKKAHEEEKPLRFLQLIEKPIPRPPTPRIEVPDEV